MYLVDVWRGQNGEDHRYSWFRSNKKDFNLRLSACRIDLALVSQGFVNKVINTTFITGLRTDHSALYVAIKCSVNDRGKGYWKLNTTMLAEEKYLELINDILERYSEQLLNDNPVDEWDRMKQDIKNASVKYARTRASEKSLIIANLSEKASEMEEKYDVLSEDELRILSETKSELQEMMEEKARGLIFRSKAKWYEEGERGTKYFASLEKKRYNARMCDMLIDEHGNHVTQEKDLLQMQRDFYAQLFESNPEVNFTLENESGIKIGDLTTAAQENVFVEEELTSAVRSLANGKTPGKDGIPAEFYKVFYPNLKQMLLRLVSFCYENKVIPKSSMNGVINLIPKQSKDSRYLKNLRPITLLNCDYKIMEKLVSNRIEPALPQIIHQDQQGFMSGRRISANIWRVLDLINLCDRDQLPGLLIQIDFAKCFDKIEFQAILGSMRYFGFSVYLQEWVTLLYKGFTAEVQSNGKFSAKFNVTRSVHQGGCCSSFLFLLCAELMAIDMRANKNIVGISFRDVDLLLGQFADDKDLSTLFDQKNMDNIFSTLERFHHLIGFEVNYEKTTVYRIGSIQQSEAELYTQKQLNWTSIGINVLGVAVSNDRSYTYTENYSPLLKKTEAVLNVWSKCNLSLVGKNMYCEYAGCLLICL